MVWPAFCRQYHQVYFLKRKFCMLIKISVVYSRGSNLTIYQHWFRWWLGVELAPCHHPNQWWPSLQYIYITRPQWVKMFWIQPFSLYIITKNCLPGLIELTTWPGFSHFLVSSLEKLSSAQSPRALRPDDKARNEGSRDGAAKDRESCVWQEGYTWLCESRTYANKKKIIFWNDFWQTGSICISR